ncbi:MAG TPA: RNA 2',3'-cyclic phosphodiesterase [bacterium]|nr:RNA 2',3'-cyclic phosphodiesterase [bacterium]
MRAFSGIKIADNIIKSLEELLLTLQQYKDRIKIVRQENLHITFKFLGNISNNLYREFVKNLQDSVSRISPFTVEISGIGFFPDKKRARVIWVGICQNKNLLELYKTTEDSAKRINIQPEKKPFQGHITVGRVKLPLMPGVVDNLEKKFQNKIWGKMAVKNITIFESILYSDGPIYKELETITLGGSKNG